MKTETILNNLLKVKDNPFNADNIKKICDILGTTELVMRLYGELKPALIVDEKTDNQVVITPFRKYC